MRSANIKIILRKMKAPVINFFYIRLVRIKTFSEVTVAKWLERSLIAQKVLGSNPTLTIFLNKINFYKISESATQQTHF